MFPILALFTACAHFTSLSPGLEPGEFYVVVQRDNPLLFIPINAPQGAVFRCRSAEMDAGKNAVTSCVRVLDALDAEALARRPGVTRNTVIHPLTGDKGFPASTAAPTTPPPSEAYGSAVAVARSLISSREALIAKEGMTAEQAATVRAQAKREACAMIATVTDRRCDEVLFLAPP